MIRKPKRYRIVGRDAKTGRFISVAQARRRKASAIVQRIGYALALFFIVMLPAVAATVTLSNGSQICTASQVVVTCADAPPPVETCEQFIQRMYRDILKTKPDADGFAYWVGQCSSTMTREAIEVEFRRAAPPPGPPPAPPPSCNPSAAIPMRTVQDGVWIQQSTSTQVFAVPVPPHPNGRSVVVFTQGQLSWTSPDARTEFVVSKCPGSMDSAVPQCRLPLTSFVNANSMQIYTKPVPAFGFYDQATLGDQGCFAPSSEGQWYVNIRWTFSGSNAFSLQWFAGGW